MGGYSVNPSCGALPASISWMSPLTPTRSSIATYPKLGYVFSPVCEKLRTPRPVAVTPRLGYMRLSPSDATTPCISTVPETPDFDDDGPMMYHAAAVLFVPLTRAAVPSV